MMSQTYAPFDAEESLIIQPRDAGLVESVGTGSQFIASAGYVDITELFGQAEWNSGRVQDKQYDLNIHVNRFDDKGGSCVVLGYFGQMPLTGSSAVQFARYDAPDQGTGFLSFPINVEAYRLQYPDRTYIYAGVFFTNGANIEYSAWLSQVNRR
jgi:hypothetical protein